MLDEKFDALLSFDKNMKYQQNFKKFSIPVLVLNAPDNSYLTLTKLSSFIKIKLASPLQLGITEIKL